MRLDFVHMTNVRVPSANAIQVTRMSEAFGQAGADVTLWHPDYRAPDRLSDDAWRGYYGVGEAFAARAVPSVFSPRLLASRALPVLKLGGYLRMLTRYRPGDRGERDVIYTRCFTAAAFFPRALRAIRSAPRPLVVFEAHEFPPSPGRLRALRGVDAIVSITRAAADEIIAAVGVPRDRVLIAPDGVPAEWLDHPIARDDARARLGLRVAPARALAVYTGRFHPGTARFLRGVAERLRGAVEVVAVGMGAAQARAELGRGDDDGAGLAILDPVPARDARLYQAAADVLVMPHDGAVSWARYTSPLKLFEYMAAGRPIVASHLPVLDEVVRHGDNAWLVALADPDAVAHGVRHVLADAGLGARLVERARQDVRRYTWQARARSILDFTRSVGEAT